MPDADTSPSLQELELALERLIIEVCDLEDLEPGEIGRDTRLIGGELDLNSLDAVEIAASIDYEYGVRIQDLSTAKETFRTVGTLAEHIARERGWLSG
jgi:acyl carrier protein